MYIYIYLINYTLVYVIFFYNIFIFLMISVVVTIYSDINFSTIASSYFSSNFIYLNYRLSTLTAFLVYLSYLKNLKLNNI